MALSILVTCSLCCAVYVEEAGESFDLRLSPHMLEFGNIGKHKAPVVQARQRIFPFSDCILSHALRTKSMYAKAAARPLCGPDLKDWTRVQEPNPLCYDVLLVWYCDDQAEQQPWRCVGIKLMSQDYAACNIEGWNLGHTREDVIGPGAGAADNKLVRLLSVVIMCNRGVWHPLPQMLLRREARSHPNALKNECGVKWCDLKRGWLKCQVSCDAGWVWVCVNVRVPGPLTATS